jgi:hypothetical protein
MLAEKYPVDRLQSSLVDSWHPHPTVSERNQWDSLPDAIRKVYIQRGEDVLEFDWPSLQATRFLDYARTGNRSRFQGDRNGRRNALGHLVLAECMEGKGRFVDQIVNGVWATCEETYWGVPAHLSLQAAGKGLPDASEPTVDLFAAETSALLAWTHYLVGETFESVSPLVCPRIEQEIDRRILSPLLEREDFWWMRLKARPDGRRVNNWNPWINSNWLMSFLLIEQDRDRLLQGIHKSMRSLDQFIEPYPEDGGCDEGAGYWGRAAASLFDCLEILESATDGLVNEFDSDLLRNMGSFIYKAHIKDRYFVNFADAPVMTTPVPSILYRYGKRVGDDHLSSLGAWFAESENYAQKGFGDSVARQLPALFTAADLFATPGSQHYPRDAWFPGIEVMTARSQAGSADGFFLAAKGGTNAESHNHNDIGTFVVFTDGKPLLIDTGVEPYTAKNSSPQRYDIWTINSNHHNLPEVNGQTQQPGFEFAAKSVNYQATEASASLKLDISGAYPAEAGLASLHRQVTLNREVGVEIEDACVFAETGGEVVLHLMTACDVQIGDGTLTLKEAPLPDGRVTGSGQITFDQSTFTASTEEISLEGGERLHKIWGHRVVRISLKASGLGTRTSWTVKIDR